MPDSVLQPAPVRTAMRRPSISRNRASMSLTTATRGSCHHCLRPRYIGRSLMHGFTPVPSLVGGVLIGLAASLLYLSSGRTAGISGIFGGLAWGSRGDRAWRLQFVAGLLAGGLLLVLFRPLAFGAPTRTISQLAAAGLLVG